MARDLDPESSEAWVGLGRVAEARGQRDEARVRYERARAVSRVDPEGLWRLAALELESGNPDRARALLSELPQRLARAPEAAARLALAERSAGRLDLAKLRLNGSLRANPSAVELLLVQAEVLEDERGEAAALGVREKAHAAAPRNRAARLSLARSLALAGADLERALSLAEAAVGQQRSPDALEALALARSARREFAAALALADEGLAGAPEPTRSRLMFRRAEALAGLGRRDAASAALAEARRLAGADPRAEQAAARVERLLSAGRG
jgi:Flp pilus assembly protein TadD